MKKRTVVTVLLILAAAGTLMLSLYSLEGVNEKIQLTAKGQKTMEIEATPTPFPEMKLDVRAEEKKEESKLASPPTPQSIPKNPAAPVLTLVTDKVEIKVGQSFDLIAQVADITDDKDNRSTLFRRIQVQGAFDVNVPGEYTLVYFATDTDGYASPQRELKLIVKAA